MPYEYLTFNEVSVERGPVSGSYFPEEIQNLYDQSSDKKDSYFGLSEHDNVELSIYNSNQEFLRFSRIVQSNKFLVTNGTFLDENQNLQSYTSIVPSTNYVKYDNKILMDVNNHLSSSNLSDGLYYVSYNFIRDIAGNSKNNLIIKEVSPSRTEVKFSINFDKDLNYQNTIDYGRIRSFAEKKYLFIQIYDSIFKKLDQNEVEKNFQLFNESDKLKASNLLGLKSISELQEFISNTYNGYSKILKYYSDDTKETLIEESKKFDGVKDQIKNFCRKNNIIPFSSEDILTSFETITKQISQLSILQKTTIKPEDLDFLVEFFVNVIFKTNLQNNIQNALDKFKDKFYGYFKNVINFDNGNFVKILNHTSYLNTVTNLINIHVKLEEPLPYEYDVKSVCWISNISIAPYYLKVNLFSDSKTNKIFLNGVNFNVNVDTVNSSNELKTTSEVNSIEKSKIKLKQRYNNLSVNYDDFENFIIYSSAELRSKVARNKWLEYDSLENKKNLILESASASNETISASLSVDYNNYINKQLELLETFDDYESYIFFNTSSINKKIEDSIEYDKQNADSLINQLPEFIKDDPDSSDYLIFTSMIGHFFDNILMYIKKFPRNYSVNNDDKLDFPKEYIEEFLNSLNWKTKNIKSDNSSIKNYYLNNDEINNDISSSYFDYTKSIFNRFLNNLPHLYKTRGTSECVNLLNNIFGVPSGMLTLREYGTNNLNTNISQRYEYENIDYLTKFDTDEYITFNVTSSDFILKKLNEFTSSISGGFNYVTSSYSEVGIGVNSIELSFKWKDIKNVPPYNSKVNLIKKIRNDQSDWELYILKDKKRELGKLVFEFNPPEVGSVSKIESDYLPYFNESLYTVSISRDILEDYVFDQLENSSSYKEEGNSKITEVFSFDDKRYLPYKYDLRVNQIDGTNIIFTDSKSATYLYDRNKYFSSGSYFVGNYLSDESFKGNIDKIKIYKTKLEKSDFDEHSFNINSYSKEIKSDLYSDLLFLWKFDTPVDLWSNTSSVTFKSIKNQNEYYDNYFIAHNFKGTDVILPYPDCVPGTISKFPYQFDRVVLKQSLYQSNNYGPNYKNNPKIDKLNQFATSNFVPYDYSTDTDDVIGSDSNLIGYFISPYSYLENKIEEFLGKEGISKIIGDPKNLDKQEYEGLRKLQTQFSNLNKKYIYPQESYSTYKFYLDFTVFDYIQDILPSRSSVKRGLLIEPSVFERKKINIKSISMEDSKNNEFEISFDNKAKFSSSFVNTTDTENKTEIECLPKEETILYPLNYQHHIIYDTIDDRDFVYSKYGKDIKFKNDKFSQNEIYKIKREEYRDFKNNDGNLITFFSDYDLVQSVGSGSVTGSLTFKNSYEVYSGSLGSGYSDRHLNKIRRSTGKRAYKAISNATPELFGVDVGVINEKLSTYYSGDSNDGIIFIKPLYGTNRNFVIYNETEDDTYLNVNRDEYITISNLSGSSDQSILQTFTIGDFGVIGSTPVPIFKFDVAVGITTQLSGAFGSAIRVYDVQTGIAGDWIVYNNQISNTEDIDNVPFIKVYYSGINRDEGKCVIVDGKSNEIIYGSNDSFLKTKIKFYDYIKGESNRYNTVDRSGNYKGSPPIITINGFLKLREETDDLGIAAEIVDVDGTNQFKFLPSTFTASLETSASLESYIYNL